ncbi:2-C-methyl-D-erythritol 4-phosphate cytidylyltransferase [Thiospirochaeta perfilievii]|uniref:2-C-methyl-D-erythritol 4-phosphate cytidylyltransferase n=1 Tax=Thiospirochaeta perfilievii TaxID=252967 RepID=A0A5C1QE78_9SPIO|nr:IspD/TarI family cytidylyltransferase [Thiospirochaeta perfilievii]QEN05024.1 2-C-methyl-D-erythritol 4-phosphate cytidylyltransferase [Thiospirochaeta perfilievii]
MISTILLSGGVGSRSGKNIPKQYCELDGKVIFLYCIDELIKANLVEELVVVYGDGFKDLIVKLLNNYKNCFSCIKFVKGGSTRQESVLNGLKECSGSRVLLHESARPLITDEELLKVANHPSQNVTMGIDIPFTVLKHRDGKIDSILNREELFNVQLPQKFNREDLLKAHICSIKDGRSFTDDSSLMFYYKYDVAVISGSEENIKITSANDFSVAEGILNSRKNRSRV